MQEIYYPSCDGKTNIHACIWQAEGDTKAVLQIIHGMAEYAYRYAPLAEYLNKFGITVCAEDHLGHGKSVCTEDDLGYFAAQKGYAPVLTDIRALTEIVKPKYEGVPYFVMGHSMGSFFCRKYVSLYGSGLAGAIIMGTGFKGSAVTGGAKFITRLVALFKGWRHRSKFIDNSAFGSYNKKFENRTRFDWLSKNPDNVDAYIADPLCGIPFTCNAFFGLFSIISEACKSKVMKAVPDTLPLYVVAGAQDPVGDYGKGVDKFVQKLKRYGKNVTEKLYEDCRHEIANDVCRDELFADLANFLNGLAER
ncbi:MAG: alpha/beta hydrolase [Clostridia bacterium]|nr:alpha/beta hydrolase [Clostridia bacterium]